MISIRTKDETKTEESGTEEGQAVASDPNITRVASSSLSAPSLLGSASQRRVMVPMASTRNKSQNILDEKRAIAGRSNRMLSFQSFRRDGSNGKRNNGIMKNGAKCVPSQSKKSLFNQDEEEQQKERKGTQLLPSQRSSNMGTAKGSAHTVTTSSRDGILREKMAIAGRSRRGLTPLVSRDHNSRTPSQTSTKALTSKFSSVKASEMKRNHGIIMEEEDSEKEEEENNATMKKKTEQPPDPDNKRLALAHTVEPSISPLLPVYSFQKDNIEPINGVGSFAVAPMPNRNMDSIESLDEDNFIVSDTGQRFRVTSRRDHGASFNESGFTAGSASISDLETIRNAKGDIALEAELVESNGDLYQQLRDELRKESLQIDAVVAVPEESEEEKRSKLSKRQRCLVCIMCLLLVLGIVLGLGLGLTLSSEDVPIEILSENITDVPTVVSPTPPTTSPIPTFGTPSAVPSTAPTPILCDGYFLELVGSNSSHYSDVVANFLTEIGEATGENTTNWEFCDAANLAVWVMASRIQMDPDSSIDDLLERFALTIIYLSLGGENWDSDTTSVVNWLEKVDTCDLEFYTCNRNSLNDLDLADRDLQGTIPSQIGLLTRLSYLSLHSNAALEGSIPTEIGMLTELEWLVLSSCAITGAMPSSIGQLMQLVDFDIGSNEISGLLPTEMGSLTTLTALEMQHNYLTALPTQLFSLARLEYLSLAYNSIQGSLHTEIGLLTSIQSLLMEQNMMNGILPSEIGLVEGLTSLSLGNNNFTSSLPTEIGALSKLDILNMEFNELTGPIPSQVGELEFLHYLYLNNNDLSGSIPSDLGNCRSLFSLNLTNNALTGSIPSEIGLLSVLDILSLQKCDLNGTLPTELGSLSQMTDLNIASNSLSGKIDVIANLSSLVILFMYENQFKGSIPENIGNLDRLQQWDARSNRLLGPIPTGLSEMTDLAQVYFNQNSLNSSLPTEIATLSLEQFRVNSNRLSGSIPVEIWSMTTLIDLDLKSNSLTGSIATEIGLCSDLQNLILDDNRFSGTVPSEIGELKWLTNLDLGENPLITGTIPEEFNNASQLATIILCKTSLAGTISDRICDATRLIVELTIECDCCETCT